MINKIIKKDDWGVVLDFLPQGHREMSRSQPVAHVLGDKYFSLLEVIVREGVNLKPEDRVYIGDEKREKVKYIVGRIEVSKLTIAAKEELTFAIENIIEKTPERFLDFLNKSGPITTRMHSLELLPGLGKKHLWAVIDERKKKLFESLADFKKRVTLIPDPKKMFIRRILDELEDKDKYHIFVLKPKEEMERRRYGR